MPMTADEALNAIRECAYHDGAGVQSAGLAEDAEAAEAEIREAFDESEGRAIDAMLRCMEAVADQLESGNGTYRHLIYTRMGLSREGNAYGRLHSAWARLYALIEGHADHAIAARAREELARLEAQVEDCLSATENLTRDELADSRELKLGWIAANRIVMLKRIIDGRVRSD